MPPKLDPSVRQRPSHVDDEEGRSNRGRSWRGGSRDGDPS